MADELFDQLSEYKWKGISIPATTFRVSLRQDLAVHRFPDRDGGHVEATGRAPMQFSAHIPFLNTIVPGKTETWGVLYPTQYRAFLAACADRTTGLLNHPELGGIRCKLESCDTVWDSTVRSGVYVDATWIESTFDPDESNKTFESNSPVTEATLAALDLDATITAVQPAPPSLPEWKPSFGDAMRSLQAVGDTVSLLSAKVAGLQNGIAYRAGAVGDSISRAVTSVSGLVQTTNLTSVRGGRVTGTSTVNGPAALLWPISMAAQRSTSSVDGLRRALGTKKQSISLYPVPKDSTLAGICGDIGAGLSDVIRLNPSLVAGPIVSARTVVRYYTP